MKTLQPMFRITDGDTLVGILGTAITWFISIRLLNIDFEYIWKNIPHVIGIALLAVLTGASTVAGKKLAEYLFSRFLKRGRFIDKYFKRKPPKI